MDGQIPVNNNMPDDLKAAINYLNTNHISLTDTFEDDEEIDNNVDTNFGGVDLNDTEIDDSDEDVDVEDESLSDIKFGEDNVDVDDLNSMF